jgi:pheromone shutdown-related protein TraB
MSERQAQEPLCEIEHSGAHITLLGTAHVSRASAEKVKALLATDQYDAVAVELCPSRYHAIIDPDALTRMDLFQVLRTGKASMVIASLALGAYQQRMAEQFGIEPGAEMREAVANARERRPPVLLIDRELGVTLKRTYRNVPWWRRLTLLSGLLASVVSREKVTEEEVERLKEGDVLESAFAQFADQARELYSPLIEERDRYMAARLQGEIARTGSRRILAIVGAGHMRGIEGYLTQQPAPSADEIEATISELEQLPPASRWPKLIPWLIVALILFGFALGFRRGAGLGWQLVADWVLINGSLSALGALVAAAHPLTILTAFVAAPLTSLNPMVGAGMVTAAVEVYLRRPSVGDFGRLRRDTTHWKGWWRNRVARTLMVFILSTVGSALGTYLAGIRILDRLLGS